MPLTKGCSRKAIQKNTKAMLDEGRPADQAYAIAMSTARRACGEYLFCYGSNNSRQLAERLGHVVCAKPGIVVNRKRVFRGHSKRWGGGVASLAPALGQQVQGLLVEVTKEDLKALDAAEGVAQKAYVRKNVTAWLVTGGKRRFKQVSAWVYLATSKEDVEPSRAYLEATAKTVGEFWTDGGKAITWRSFPIQ